MYDRNLYCGHWTDDELSRTLYDKLKHKSNLEYELSRLTQAINFIEQEQNERIRLKQQRKNQ